MVVRNSCAVYFILPVRVIAIFARRYGLSMVGQELLIFRCIQYIYSIGYTFYCGVSTVGKHWGTSFSTLCGDHDYTIRCPRTINGRRGSVLQYINRLDIIRRYQVDGCARNSVYYIKGSRACRKRRWSSQLNRGSCSWVATALVDR